MFVSEDGPQCAETKTQWRVKPCTVEVHTHIRIQQAAEHVPSDTNVGFCEREMILQHRCRKNNFLSRATHMGTEHVNDP